MSDYYGTSTLEDWLAEEVFSHAIMPPEVVVLFEKWRDAVERDIENWMGSDDGEGNNVSWRGWGRGFNAIPITEEGEFDHAVLLARNFLSGAKAEPEPVVDEKP